MGDLVKIDIDWSCVALVELLKNYEFETVLDVGSGVGNHSRILRMAGKKVFSMDKFVDAADIKVDILDFETDQKFDCIFCSHVVEHQRNVGFFLDKIYSLLSDDGILCIAGPCHDPNLIVEGHLKTWTAAIALQNLVLAGFDCSDALIYQIHETVVICKMAPIFEKTTASFKFINHALWPFEPALMKITNEMGHYINGSLSYPLTFVKNSSAGKIHKVKVKNGEVNQTFVAQSSRFFKDVFLFLDKEDEAIYKD